MSVQNVGVHLQLDSVESMKTIHHHETLKAYVHVMSDDILHFWQKVHSLDTS